jgi:hypothetical protein
VGQPAEGRRRIGPTVRASRCQRSGPMKAEMPKLRDMLPEEEEALRRLLAPLRESAKRREPLLPEEKELILAIAADLKASGHWVAELLVKMASAESQVRQILGVSDDDDRSPAIEKLTPLLAGSRRLCKWPASDFIYSPTVLLSLGFLRQQNDQWLSPEKPVSRAAPKNPERILWSEDALSALWSTKLLVGANRETKATLAPSEDLDRLVESLRFNRGRSGRRHARTVAVLIEKNLYVYYCAFLGLLKKGHLEAPEDLRDEPSLEEFLRKNGYPQFIIGRLAQELAEHRQRRRGVGSRLALTDRAALMLAEFEGRRGEFGLPEPADEEESLDLDTSKPPSVAMRRPPLNLPTVEAKTRYKELQERALYSARARVRQVKALWNAGSVVPKSDIK